MAARSKARKRALDVIFEADQRAGRPDAHAIELAARAEEKAQRFGQTAAPAPTRGAPEPDRPSLTQVLAARISQPGTQTALPQYSVEIVEGVAAHADRIDEALTTFSQGWTLDRMPAVDRAILRIATWEIVFNDEVPDGVAIDEAVTLATSLSTDESASFVNGLLSRISVMGDSLRD